MKRFFTALALVMLAIGALALFLTPIFWLPEPVLAFQVGIGAGIFSILFGLAVLVLLFVNAIEWGKAQSAEKSPESRMNRTASSCGGSTMS